MKCIFKAVRNIKGCVNIRTATHTLTFGPPPCIFRARTVATSTTTSGFNPDVRHLMLKNFSMPMSAPKPASVTEQGRRQLNKLLRAFANKILIYKLLYCASKQTFCINTLLLLHRAG